MSTAKTFADEVREIAALQKVRNEARALHEAQRLVVKFPPSGCRHCRIGRHGHARQWTAEAGTHVWTPPTTEQIKTRMLARRTAQTTNTEK